MDEQEAVFRLAVKQYTPLDNLNPQPGEEEQLAAERLRLQSGERRAEAALESTSQELQRSARFSAACACAA